MIPKLQPPTTKAPWSSRPHTFAEVTGITAAVLAAIYGLPVAADDQTLEEVIVTASYHPVSAQDLPSSITAITGETLQQSGIEDMAQLAGSVAGINFTDKGPFGGVTGATLVIRGLNSESTAGQFASASPIVPPVATYVDDTPLFVNLRLQDLERVEILRGPQGTLYGSGSLGGTIRFVQNPPDTTAFDSKVEIGASDTAHTHEPNADIAGMLNLPLSETFAIRLNVGLTDDAGFINQPSLYRLNASGAPLPSAPPGLLSPPQTYANDGTNSYHYRTARLAALWKPTDAFRAQLSYYYQLSTADGYPFSAPALGVDNLASTDHIQATTSDKVDLVALAMEYDLGFATLTSDTSWARHANQTIGDITNIYENLPFYSSLYGSNPRALVTSHEEFIDAPWSQELRLASKTGGALDWVGGLFFKSETTTIQEHDFYPGYLDYFNACVPVYGVSNGDGVTPSECGIGETAYTAGTGTSIDGIPIVKDLAYIGDFEIAFKDVAAYGEVTWHLTSNWSLTGGTRLFKQTVSQTQQTGLLFDGPGFIANQSLSNSWQKAQWKINSAYQLDKSNLVYATWSQGFRRGGVNTLPPAELVVGYVTNPGLYKVQPDTADNYELGAKGTWGNRIRYSAAIFDIQWHNFQEGAFLTPLNIPGAINIGDAYSRGVETELAASLTDRIGAHFEYTYNTTKVTSISPLALSGLTVPPSGVGTPLAGTPKNSLAAGLSYEHLPMAGGELRFALSAHYQSSFLPALSATIPYVGGYTMMDARATFTRKQWMGTLYVDNLTNQLGITGYTDPASYGKLYQALVSTPRTIGIKLGYSFSGW